MKKIIILLLAVSSIMMNCKSTSTYVHRSKVVTLPLAAAAYDIGPETSGKACNYEIGWFSFEGIRQPGLNASLTGLELIPTVVTGGAYWYVKQSLVSSGIGALYNVETAAMQRALKKTDGDVLFEMKSTVTTDGFFFPDVCVTVSGKSANLTGPSVTAKK
ncbi:LEPBI_I0682 family protein [Leptospira levettii]|uniref:Lipoprotein n=1 Tax=Leptospira levettii TaxID=2023178 RepID=A0AAW5V532_9LEPT|nr:hypothetical protein [Leptospira levettii]MCW7464799.1 hypothetical protein [Leptospira levettii]MCW7511017.1 hypothetical protein [Leptospira levettii]MCW7514771.1 hypothetical protein [Leptospira levettii]